ncbi:hypothetical protein QAD02_005303 [Eretmocerus hayati]|uniref:Uncharacterized protein n=1 Tax=Eretmocerus hayati TaxID=131215 RepID=A0ACC2NT42_9HYME|nr:hypothetical protein QAD02_005303 [Eretmocerus hayati]
MASYFGEIVHPSSRAFWNEIDDDEFPENTPNIEFSLQWSEPEPTAIDKLLIVESEMLTEYVKASVLQGTKCVCTIVDSSNQECAKIHFDSNDYICTVSKKVSLGDAGYFTKAIVPLISKTKKLYVFTSNHISNYKSEDCDSSVLIKSLCSCEAKKDRDPKISILDQPNIVSGVGAGGK